MSATVLLIEDYNAHRRLLQTVVGRMGCQAIEAPDGRSGLALAAEQAPALIVLDLILPDIDGVEVLHRLRDHPVTANVPILIVTAVDAQERVVEALDAGADDYVTKPFDSTVLQARMKVLLRNARLQQDLKLRARQAEVSAAMARSAANGDLQEVCYEIAAAMEFDDRADRVELYLVSGDRLVGPLGVRDAESRSLPLTPLLNRGGLGRVLCGEVPWQRLRSSDLQALGGEFGERELVALPLRHGRRVMGLAMLSREGGGLRENQIRAIASLGEAAALALAAGVERTSRSEHESRYRLLFDQMGDGVAVVDPESGACREVNQTLAGWLSAMPLALNGRPFAALFEPDTAASVSEAVAASAHGQKVMLRDLRLAGGEGKAIPVEITFRRIRQSMGLDVIAVLRDLRQVDAVGRYEQVSGDLTRLARSVRALNHEINNPLTCIIGLTQLLQLRLQELPEFLPQLDRILESADQITTFTRQLRQAAVTLGGDEPLGEVDDLLSDLSAADMA